jgi:hypothetical protein
VVVVDPAQAVVGGERLALDQADGGQLADPLGVQLTHWLAADPRPWPGGRSWFLHVGHAAHADGAQPAPQGDQGMPRVRSLRSTSMPRMKSSASYIDGADRVRQRYPVKDRSAQTGSPPRRARPKWSG